MTSPPSGGPATINGVLYQMLWSLLRALKMQVRECDRSPTDGAVERAVLVLEPREGGGDVQERTGPRRIVEQLKAKAGGGTWSLTAVVKDVLPDLYLARDPAFPDTEFRFVTEGRMGRWSEVDRFFRGLKARGKGTDLLGQLEDKRELKFQRAVPQADEEDEPSFWPLAQYTERSMFERIVEVIRDRQVRRGTKVGDKETIEQTRDGVWELLANFTFVGEQTIEAVRREVDALLLALVDADSGLAEKRDALLTGLARRATQGGAEIEAHQFLQDYALESTPLTAWVPLRDRAAAYLGGVLYRSGYNSAVDVRQEAAAELAGRWLPATPILAVAGESGAGKSWLLYAIARQVAPGQSLVVVTEATGDGDMDCQRAADIFWMRIKRNDNSLSLDRIADRRRELVQPRAEQWLTLFIDGVRSQREARQLAMQPWEEWNIRVACACLPSVAGTLKAEARGRAVIHEVADFSTEELRQYLGLRLDEGAWGRIPPDVRSTLLRPLLARLFCDLTPAGGWIPTTEYELYNRCWQRLHEGDQGDHPLDAVPLRRLALALLKGGKYPWAAAQLDAAGLDSEALARLCRVGWLQPVPPSHHQVWHDRLLNWAVAEAICEQYDSGQMDLPTLCDRLQRLLFAPADGVARPLGYVPMDVLWLLTDSARGAANAVGTIIKALEGAP
jgi:hypothetical protein